MAVKYQIASTKIQNIIRDQSLTGISKKRRYFFFFGLLYLLSVLLIVAYTVVCLKDWDAKKLRRNQKIFVSLATGLLGLLWIAYILSHF